jgi:site-specific recombinase XerC
MVGHVDKETTQLYTHLNIDDLRREAQKIKTSAVSYKLVTSKNEEKNIKAKSS